MKRDTHQLVGQYKQILNYFNTTLLHIACHVSYNAQSIHFCLFPANLDLTSSFAICFLCKSLYWDKFGLKLTVCTHSRKLIIHYSIIPNNLLYPPVQYTNSNLLSLSCDPFCLASKLIMTWKAVIHWKLICIYNTCKHCCLSKTLELTTHQTGRKWMAYNKWLKGVYLASL